MRVSPSSPVRALLAASSLFVACGPGGLGEPCEDPGSTAACVEGAVCMVEGSETGAGTVWDHYVCRPICHDHADCAEGEVCAQASGRAFDLRGCQPQPE